MIVEIVQAQPYAFTTGYYSARIWVNGADMSRVYFGNFTTGHLFSDRNTDQIHLCSTTTPGTNDTILDTILCLMKTKAQILFFRVSILIQYIL